MPIDVEKIRTLRLKNGLTLQKAAEKAGFKTKQAWARIEAGGQPNLGVQFLERVAHAIGVRAKDLLK